MEDREKIWERRGLFISLFYSTTKPPFFLVRLAHPLGKTQRVALNCIEQSREKQGKKKREEKNRGGGGRKPLFFSNSKCPFFWGFLLSLSSELLCFLCGNHIGGCWCRGNSPLQSPSSIFFFSIIIFFFFLIQWVALAPRMWLPKLILHPPQWWKFQRRFIPPPGAIPDWWFWIPKPIQKMRGTTSSRKIVQRGVMGLSAWGLGWFRGMLWQNRMLLGGLLGSLLLQQKPFRDGFLSKQILFRS